MGNQDEKIRGWKDIATAVGTSERTARRWEKSRGLPVRRHPGERDAVFALRSELDEWHKQSPRSDEDEPTVVDGAGSSASADPGPAPGGPSFARQAALGRWRLLAALVVVAIVGIAAGWLLHRRAAPLGHPPAAVQVEAFTLELSRPDGWGAMVTIADGGAGQFSGPPGATPVILRPRRVPAGLMLEIGRADGRPVTGRPDAPGPPVLLLEPNRAVVTGDPFPFTVCWVLPSSKPTAN